MVHKEARISLSPLGRYFKSIQALDERKNHAHQVQAANIKNQSVSYLFHLDQTTYIQSSVLSNKIIIFEKVISGVYRINYNSYK
jgi:hypothetical protein